MIIKKFGSIIVAAALIVTVFSGCGSKAPEPTPSASPTPEVSATPTVSPSASPEGETDRDAGKHRHTSYRNEKALVRADEEPRDAAAGRYTDKSAGKDADPTKAPEPSVSVSELMNKMVSALRRIRTI